MNKEMLLSPGCSLSLMEMHAGVGWSAGEEARGGAADAAVQIRA